MPQQLRETRSPTNMIPSSNQATYRPLTKQQHSQPDSPQREKKDRGVISAARKLGRAVAKFAKLESSEPRRDQGIDYATFHALYGSPAEEPESIGISLSAAASSSMHTLVSSREDSLPSSSSSCLYSRGRSFEATSSPLRFGYSTDSLPSSPSSARVAQRRMKYAKLVRHFGENTAPDLVSLDPGTPQLPSETPKIRRRLMPLSRSNRFPPPVEYKVPDPGPESDASELSETSSGRWNSTRPKITMALPQLRKSKPRPRNIEIVVTLQSESTECFTSGTEDSIPPLPVFRAPNSSSGASVYSSDTVDFDGGDKQERVRFLEKQPKVIAKVHENSSQLDLSGISLTRPMAEMPPEPHYLPDRKFCSSPAPSVSSQASEPSVYYSDVGDTQDEHDIPLSTNGVIPSVIDPSFNIDDHTRALTHSDEPSSTFMTDAPSWRDHWRRTEKLSQFFGVDLNTLGASSPLLPTIGEAY